MNQSSIHFGISQNATSSASGSPRRVQSSHCSQALYQLLLFSFSSAKVAICILITMLTLTPTVLDIGKATVNNFSPSPGTFSSLGKATSFGTVRFATAQAATTAPAAPPTPDWTFDVAYGDIYELPRDNTTNETSTVRLCTVGYLRMSFADHVTILAGYKATIEHANRHGVVSNVNFRLLVTTINCTTAEECMNLTPAQEADVQRFISYMPTFAAIAKPNYIISPRIIDEATAIGGLPIIDPVTVRAKDYAKGASHVINFQPYITSELTQLFTYMQQAKGCAYSGILYEEFSELTDHIPFIQKMFTDGGLPLPPAINFGTATDEELMDFLNADHRRKCFIMMLNHNTGVSVATRLINKYKSNFSANTNFFGTSLMSGAKFLYNGKGTVFERIHFNRWAPAHVESTPTLRRLKCSDDIEAYYAEFLNTYVLTADDRHHFGSDDLPAKANDGMLMGYLVMQFFIEAIRSLVAEYNQPGQYFGMNRVEQWQTTVNVIYNNPRSIGGFPFWGRMTTECPLDPLEQVCFCNRPCTMSYLYKVNATDGIPYLIFDDKAIGQRGIASMELTSCHLNASSRVYPITSIFVRIPSDYVITDATGMAGRLYTLSEMLEAQTAIDMVLNERVRSANYEAIVPARPQKYSSVELDITTAMNSLTEAINLMTDEHQPFVVLGSLVDEIEDARILTLFRSVLEMRHEDDVLSHHNESWHPNILQLLPSLADYVHTVAAYYHDNHDSFTSLRVIVSSDIEAELASKSLATFGYDVPVGAIFISSSALTWSTHISGWLNPEVDPLNYNPFVFAVSIDNPDNCLMAAFTIATSETKGRLAIASDLSILCSIRFQNTFSGSSDIIFPTFLNDFWTPDRQSDFTSETFKSMSSQPVFWYVKIAGDIIHQLAQRVLYDYTTSAAEILYDISIVTSSGVAMGPFSNVSCTAEEIASNTRARTCQCTKGARVFYMNSARAWQDGVSSSDVTNGYAYHMSTCGVVYKPYVPPASDSSLATGAIVGIAIGCAAFVFIIVGGILLLNYFFFGRNNHAAPKDCSRAFAIVFTDIQSSTALWARAPAAMSDAVSQHHSIMRKVLSRNDGYEVKTIGDSFMVAFKEADDAVRFGIEIQQELFDAKWNDEINACYIEILAELAAVAAAVNQQQSNDFETTDGTEKTVTTTSGDDRVGASDGVHHRHHQNHNDTTPFVESSSNDANLWNGLRVRIGISYGFGDIRKDPVTHGYDYYGTVVNTAARVEGVGHGGQVLITDDTNNAIGREFIPSCGAISIYLGPQPLRGLDQPIKLYQVSPSYLHARSYPALRLHIELELDESLPTDTNTTSSSDAATLTPAELVAHLCGTKQYLGTITSDYLLGNLQLVNTLFGPAKPKWVNETLAKLGDFWGFERSHKAVLMQSSRNKLMVNIMGKVSKAMVLNHLHNAATSGGGGGGASSPHNNTTLSTNSSSTVTTNARSLNGVNHQQSNTSNVKSRGRRNSKEYSGENTIATRNSYHSHRTPTVSVNNDNRPSPLMANNGDSVVPFTDFELSVGGLGTTAVITGGSINTSAI